MYNFFVCFHTTYVDAPVHAPDGGLAALVSPGVLALCKKGQIKITELEKNSPITVSVNRLLVPRGVRKPQTSLRPSRYIPNRIGVEIDHKCGLIAS